MFENLPVEIIYFSVLPVALILLADLIMFLLAKGKRDNNFYFNYFIKISMITATSLVLPLITGYTWWITESFWNKGLFFDNFAYIILIIFLSLCLITLIIWIYLRLLKLTNLLEENEA